MILKPWQVFKRKKKMLATLRKLHPEIQIITTEDYNTVEITNTISVDASCWLIALNASYDSKITGIMLADLFGRCSGFIRSEMFLGAMPHSFILFNSPQSAYNCYKLLDNTLISQWNNKLLLLAQLDKCCDPLPLFPQRPITTASDAALAIPGLYLVPDFISVCNSLDLVCHLKSHWTSCPISTDPAWKSLQRRRVLHFGYSFDYSRNEIDRTVVGSDHAQLPHMPEWSVSILDQYTKLFPQYPFPNQLTINHYFPGGGIAPHSDRHSSFISPIVIISLGSGLVMEFRRKSSLSDPTYTTVHVYLPPCSLMVLDGDARFAWEHAIRPRTMDLIDGNVVERSERWSLTFRNLRELHDVCQCGYTHLCN
ncbi:hypothetical protein BDEG_27152 [Batrachochytrium dendrobatidis JEL423]|nr:hypothetical protein BDEG_27152 [Batrachochytrium dendrobatidis JEL423]